MTLYLKIGSMPGEHYRVLRLRKPPKVGDRFEVRLARGSRFSPSFFVRCLEIRDLLTHNLWVVERC